MVRRVPYILAALLALFVPFTCEAVKYKPFDGHEGYQDIKVSDDTYYVGFHGGNDAQYNEILLAWAARSAQLCSQAGASHYVELSYLFEPLTPRELDLFSALEPAPHFSRVAGYIYIPMYIPSGPRATKIDAPSKLAAIRCIQSPDNLMDRQRAISVTEKTREATQANIIGNNKP